MSLARVALIGGNAALALALLLTTRAALPDATWVYAGLALAAAAAWPLLRRRRLTTLLLASTGAWAMLTGILLVYVAPALPHARALRWWHAVTGIAMLLAFLAHWARNSPRLVTLARRVAERRPALAALVAGWGALALLAAASWGTPLRALFDDTTFSALTTGSLLLAAAGLLYTSAYAASPRVRPRLAQIPTRNRLRGAVDASLLAAMWLATLSALPLQYLARPLRSADAYWLVAGWHVILSVLLLALLVFHVGFNARPLASHAR